MRGEERTVRAREGSQRTARGRERQSNREGGEMISEVKRAGRPNEMINQVDSGRSPS